MKEFSAQTYDGVSTQADSGDNLVLRMKTTSFELSAIINVVDAQIEILERLAQFQLEENSEQFAIMRRTIEVTVKERMYFRGKIELVLSKLQDSQQRVGFPPPSAIFLVVANCYIVDRVLI